MDKTDKYIEGVRDGKEACLSELKERVEGLMEEGYHHPDGMYISGGAVLNLIEQMQEP